VSLQPNELVSTETVPDTPEPRLSDWHSVARRMGPNLWHWLLASGIAAGVMLVLSPVQNSWPVLVSTGLLLMAPVVFLLGWMAGMSTFAISCESFRRGPRTVRLVKLLPILFVAIVALGLLGGRYWWLFFPAVAFLGHRKAIQRMWWGAVTQLAWCFRSGSPRLAATDAEALSMATDSINESIGRRPGIRASR
jgi:hypothetical protein